jgi:phosphorylase/glycogen(starch) synthase
MSKEMENAGIFYRAHDVWRGNKTKPRVPGRPTAVAFLEEPCRTGRTQIRVGRWNVPGNPIAVLVDFSSYISKKDEIFTEFWEKIQTGFHQRSMGLH